MKHLKFTVKEYRFNRTLLEVNSDDISNDITINVEQTDQKNMTDKSYKMSFICKVTDKNKVLNISIEGYCIFDFEDSVTIKELDDFITFTPQIIFPYIRAYISSLTGLSGINPIILPLLTFIRKSVGKAKKL